MADYGIKVSKPLVGVETATAKQLHFSSSFDSLKVFDKQTKTITMLSTDTTYKFFTFAHGLSYTPAFFSVSAIPTGYYLALPYNDNGLLVYNQFKTIAPYTDATNIGFRCESWNNGVTESVNVTYWILYNQLT